MTELTFVAKSKNDYTVLVDLVSSHAATHFEDTPALFDAVVKAIPDIVIEGEVVRLEFDTGSVVGVSDLVEVTEDDDVVYALRPHRERYSKFVKNKEASATSWIVLAFNKIDDTTYLLHTAFPGRLTPSFPGGDYLPEQSKEFWAGHALVWGNQEVVAGSETNICPW